ncbi:hypothetical protein NDA11_007005 [Ustilago hordei]|nr:hypothetical protein NDA10_005109 [Ustilago hordei]KAJ1580913.1 hypothetical protein NDA15_000750 [Ustilago hordei]KAJ1582868.1 hypothetical protein NDA12_004572 [Ustilago hordei]KAJ1588818.1 hypothetical protein NDA11_007005 [Ustilago hordei]KAJ1599678.1 hypothetical protein NDA14_000187 [Ustilago hordei]
MHVSQRGARPPNVASPSTPTGSMDFTGRGAGISASAGMAGIGAGKSGAASSFRSYIQTESFPHDDHTASAQWSTSDSSQPTDPSQTYRGFSTAPSTSSFDAQAPMPSSSSIYTSHSTQQLGPSIPESSSASMPAASYSASPASSSNNQQRAISEEELLAFIDEKRARPRANGSFSTSGRSKQTKDASDSGNSLDTLDLCHKRIERLPEALVNAIKHQIVRLALGYNHITRLPDNFADLSNLRYLNIRANNFATFPECVTKMPNLEILDLSRNKIRKLPQEPGRLLALRVLSINANRLTELPVWIGRMKHLRILKLDNNPLEWPPPHISKMPNAAPPKAPSSSSGSAAAEREKAKRFEDRQMLVWISKLRSWINDPANQPRNDAVEQALGNGSNAHDIAALTRHDIEADFASPARADGVELPSAPSDGLISLQVDVPEMVQEQAHPLSAGDANTALQTSITSMPSVAVAAAADANPMDGRAAAAGLLPPLVPQSSNAHGINMVRTTASASSTVQPAVMTPSPQQDHVRGAATQSRIPQEVRPELPARPSDVMASDFTPEDTDSRQHARNNSHSVVQDIATTHQMEGRRSLKSKKSLPDLRKSHEDILQERRDVLAEQLPDRKASETSIHGPEMRSRDRTTSNAAASPFNPVQMQATQSLDSAKQPYVRKQSLLQARRVPRPSLGNLVGPSARQGHEAAANGSAATPVYGASLSAGQPAAASSQGGGLRKLSLLTVGATQAAAEAAAAALAARAGYSSNTPPRFDVGHGRMASDRSDGNWPVRSASPTVNGARNAADQERNSYFRRLSTLPPSTISKAVPAPVLKFVDGTRGVLFALSQIHAAIGQFMTPVIDERISSQFHRLLDISNGSVANLINALDRFDSLSRRGTPDASVIRGVLVTCKDSVITFRKLISVLQLQLRALQSSSDVRYARTLLLMLYGSMAEVSNSWGEMAPLVEEVQPYLTQIEQEVGSPASSDVASAANTSAEKPTPPPSTRVGSLAQKSISTTSNGSASILPSIAEVSTPVRAGSRPYLARGASRRRHAGSFSAQDLAQGAAMTPSGSNQPPFNLEDLQAASAYNTPAKGAKSRRQDSMGNSASSAATFAQSDLSERSTTVDGTVQSTAPSTPGGAGSTATMSQQRNIYSTPGATSTPTSSRQKRSGSNASSAMDQATPRSQVTTPATPAAAAGKRHAASQSNGTAAGLGGAAATAAAGSRLHAAVSDPKISVDDHLLEMVDDITKLSARVWSMLFEHLRSAGVDDKPDHQVDALPADANTRDATTGTGVDDDNGDGRPSSDEAGGETCEHTSAEGKPPAVVVEGEESTQRLRDLRDLAFITDDLTSQLRSTYLRAREEEQRRISLDGNRSGDDDISPLSAAINPGEAAIVKGDTDEISAPPRTAPVIIATPSPDNISQATVAKLFDKSHQFVRAIVNTSTLIKSISVSHEFPRDLRRLLGQVAQACSNLTVYLLWLSPTSVS